MAIDGEYEPSIREWVRDQVDLIETSGGTDGTLLRGYPVIVLTMRGRKTGKIRKVPLMKVEHDGVYLAVASIGGDPDNPVWYYNLLADPHLEVQDGPLKQSMTARLTEGDERAVWWERAVAAFPNYADYQAKTERQIPVFVLEADAS